jgi:hypothetical protein
MLSPFATLSAIVSSVVLAPLTVVAVPPTMHTMATLSPSVAGVMNTSDTPKRSYCRHVHQFRHRRGLDPERRTADVLCESVRRFERERDADACGDGVLRQFQARQL